ncbi:MAG: hypothetical protein NTX52_04575 [Planctomycetota bacterium]|nr:hypothetical protein [Planctomycetota bacterium]
MINEQDKPTVSLREAIITGIVLDVILLGIASTVMDCGVVSYLTLCATAGHWAGNILIIVRRKSRLTRIDKDFIRFGLLALIVLAFVINLLLNYSQNYFEAAR